MYNKKYFLGFSDHWVGPYTINELRDLPLAKTNKIWTEGLKEWADIESVDELRGLINLIPPALTSYDEKQRREDYKIDYVVRGLEDVGERYLNYSYVFQFLSAVLLIVSVLAGWYCIFAYPPAFICYNCSAIFVLTFFMCMALVVLGFLNWQKYLEIKKKICDVLSGGIGRCDS
ncbi:MAG: DUF4339 domain-containing protein [Chlorobiaceae bacterium]|nr:DUF4339 domain-containing protein [Chlorobiaceae bacterium]